MAEPLVAILMACHNGENYLREQLASIAQQTWKDWYLIVQDDSSGDTTLAVLNEFANQYPNQVKILEPQFFGSAQANFTYLMEYAKNDFNYFALADQDDIWLPERLQLGMEVLLDAESKKPKQGILIFSDLIVIDADNRVIAPSFFKFQKLDLLRAQQLNSLMVQNVVTGCTVLINQELLHKASPVPTVALMHDWWLALVACACGQIIPLNKGLVRYRQHQKNSVGAKGFMRSMVNALKKKKGQIRTDFYNCCHQAIELSSRNLALDTNSQELVHELAQIPFIRKWSRVRSIFKYHFWKDGIIRNVALLWFI